MKLAITAISTVAAAVLLGGALQCAATPVRAACYAEALARISVSDDISYSRAIVETASH
jgi:hypothetical protein